jgi:hypothetical protein
VVLEKELELLGGDVLKVEIPADLAQQLEANEEAAQALLAEQVKMALADSEKKEDGS